jgi:hypothetical protein
MPICSQLSPVADSPMSGPPLSPWQVSLPAVILGQGSSPDMYKSDQCCWTWRQKMLKIPPASNLDFFRSITLNPLKLYSISWHYSFKGPSHQIRSALKWRHVGRSYWGLMMAARFKNWTSRLNFFNFLTSLQGSWAVPSKYFPILFLWKMASVDTSHLLISIFCSPISSTHSWTNQDLFFPFSMYIVSWMWCYFWFPVVEL